MNKFSLAIWVLAGWVLAASAAGGEETVYLNEKWGYGFQQPADWTPGPDIENSSARPERVVRQRMYFRGPEGATIYVSVWENLSGMGLEDWFAAYRKSSWGELVDLPPEPGAEVAGEEALIFEVPATPQSFPEWIAFFEVSDRCFEISYPVSDRGASWPVFEGILNSFAVFSPRTETSR